MPSCRSCMMYRVFTCFSVDDSTLIVLRFPSTHKQLVDTRNHSRAQSKKVELKLANARKRTTDSFKEPVPVLKVPRHIACDLSLDRRMDMPWLRTKQGWVSERMVISPRRVQGRAPLIRQKKVLSKVLLVPSKVIRRNKVKTSLLSKVLQFRTPDAPEMR